MHIIYIYIYKVGVSDLPANPKPKTQISWLCLHIFQKFDLMTSCDDSIYISCGTVQPQIIYFDEVLLNTLNIRVGNVPVLYPLHLPQSHEIAPSVFFFHASMLDVLPLPIYSEYEQSILLSLPVCTAQGGGRSFEDSKL